LWGVLFSLSGESRTLISGMIELNGVSKRYGDSVAVHPIDLRVERGTTILIGPSGSGKSTLLRLMIGLIRPDAGEVLFDGTPLTPETIVAVRQRMGYVIQDGGLFPHLTARANVGLLPQYLDWDRQRIDARIAELTELVRLPADRLKLLPHQLSGGQRQRVAIIRALMLDPEVLLLDEPLAALDPMIRRELQEDLRGIIRRLGKSVVIVTHDIGEAAFFGDTIILMRGGAVVQKGGWRDLFDAPADPFVTAFINAQRPPPIMEASRA
jgi:osmoprotectant transport system ATP-binding protein